jgi:transcriptional regulator of arginine metabolism
MKVKNSRLAALRMIISSKDLGSQEELLKELNKEGFNLTQATLSRDLKQMKVAKAARTDGRYVYVLPNDAMYKRVNNSVDASASEMLRYSGFMSISFSCNIGVIKTRPGYASSLAYNIDNSNLDEIIGTIAGDDTIIIVLAENVTSKMALESLDKIIPNLK